MDRRGAYGTAVDGSAKWCRIANKSALPRSYPVLQLPELECVA